MTAPVEDLDEHRLRANFAQTMVDAGMPMAQATELAPVAVHALLQSTRTANVVGWIAMLVLLEDAKPTPPAGMDALVALASARRIAKKMIRDDLAHVLDQKFVRLVEMSLDDRWPDLIAEIKAWKKEDVL